MDGSLHRLRRFILNFAQLIERKPGEAEILEKGGQILAELIAQDGWLPPEYAIADPLRYQQYLLHCDSLERFSVVAFVWGGGQTTPVHNHTVWGLVGMLRGAELSQSYEIRDGAPVEKGPSRRLEPGNIEALSPSIGDIHKVTNAYADRTSISIHVYGANIGSVKRSVYEENQIKPFISGYANTALPNVWQLPPAAGKPK